MDSGGFLKGKPADFDPANALFLDDVIAFIRSSQAARWAELEAMLKERTAATVLVRLLLRVLPEGIPLQLLI